MPLQTHWLPSALEVGCFVRSSSHLHFLQKVNSTLPLMCLWGMSALMSIVCLLGTFALWKWWSQISLCFLSKSSQMTVHAHKICSDAAMGHAIGVSCVCRTQHEGEGFCLQCSENPSQSSFAKVLAAYRAPLLRSCENYFFVSATCRIPSVIMRSQCMPYTWEGFGM